MVLRLRAYGLALGMALTFAATADAQVSVFTSSSQAVACSLAARHGAPNSAAIATCSIAIEHEGLTGRDLAGTYVNRGVLYLRDGALAKAHADFDVALSIAPNMGEALVNRGAVKIAEKHWADGVADIDRGLTFNPEQAEKAYYNRGLAKERLDDLKGAYFDYLKASELAPNWPAPKVELSRFTVSERPKA